MHVLHGTMAADIKFLSIYQYACAATREVLSIEVYRIIIIIVYTLQQSYTATYNS